MQMKVSVKKPKKTKIFTEIRTLTLDEMTKLHKRPHFHNTVVDIAFPKPLQI